MNSTISAFYDRLREVCTATADCIDNRKLFEVPFHVHNIVLLLDCIQRTDDQSFVQSIVKDASVDVATDVANS